MPGPNADKAKQIALDFAQQGIQVPVRDIEAALNAGASPTQVANAVKNSRETPSRALQFLAQEAQAIGEEAASGGVTVTPRIQPSQPMAPPQYSEDGIIPSRIRQAREGLQAAFQGGGDQDVPFTVTIGGREYYADPRPGHEGEPLRDDLGVPVEVPPLGGSGSPGRIQFDSERALDEAQAKSYEAQAAYDNWLMGGPRPTDVQMAQLGLSREQLALDKENALTQRIQFAQTEGRAASEFAQRMGFEREQAARDARIQHNQLLLQEGEQIAEILRNPADFVARAFFNRGESSPLPRITQQDLINPIQQRQQARAAELAGLEAPIQPQPSFDMSGFQEQGAAQLEAGLASGALTPEDEARIRPQLMAKGGKTRAKRMIVGDQPSGMPTGNEEMIDNPTGAPIRIVPMWRPDPTKGPMGDWRNVGGRIQRFALGTLGSQSGMGTDYYYQNDPAQSSVSGGYSRILEGPRGERVPYPNSATVDPDTYLRNTLAPGDQAAAGPSLDQLRITTQPPGVRDVLAGRTPARFRANTGGPIPTPRLLASLSPDETTALQTSLAGMNESLSSLLFDVERRFGRTRARPRARLAVY